MFPSLLIYCLLIHSLCISYSQQSSSGLLANGFSALPFPQVTSTEIKCECLDILCDILHKFGSLMASEHEQLLGALLSQLSSNQASVRKKTVSCIGKINVESLQ